MQNVNIEKEEIKESKLDKILNKIEIVGNKMPDPVTIFFILCIGIMIISNLASGVTVINPSNNESVSIVNLLSREGLTKLLTESVNKFQQFPPLGMVIV
ncbi:AbgT family transporter, partial [Bacteroidales bacterium MSK.15.36]|nr:AbgT family transporter [Bacteroidales bacterium MSK.15.36]